MRRTHEIGGRRRHRFVAGVPAAASPATGVPSPEVAISLNSARLTLIRCAVSRSEAEGGAESATMTGVNQGAVVAPPGTSGGAPAPRPK
jgi:hypothetical protein